MAGIKLVAVSGASGLIGNAFKQNLPSDFKIVHEIKTSIIDISDITAEVEIAASKGAKDFIHLGWPASSNHENYRITELPLTNSMIFSIFYSIFIQFLSNLYIYILFHIIPPDIVVF